ncbi:hypothetical protein DFH06DRAFT_559963 [Mycena polygramma]|nr:hypothetical protein DFH06DRAFT_559963 [Mycena polygramma]
MVANGWRHISAAFGSLTPGFFLRIATDTMRVITACMLLASLLVNALPSPDPPVTLMQAQIDSTECEDQFCPIASISVLGSAGVQPRTPLTVMPHPQIPFKTYMTPVPPKPSLRGPMDTHCCIPRSRAAFKVARFLSKTPAHSSLAQVLHWQLIASNIMGPASAR